MRVLFEFGSRFQGQASGDNRDESRQILIAGFLTDFGSLRKLIMMSEEKQPLAATQLRSMAAFV
jgi:hypothetical protein